MIKIKTCRKKQVFIFAVFDKDETNLSDSQKVDQQRDNIDSIRPEVI
jgi:hypothetical protein